MQAAKVSGRGLSLSVSSPDTRSNPEITIRDLARLRVRALLPPPSLDSVGVSAQSTNLNSLSVSPVLNVWCRPPWTPGVYDAQVIVSITITAGRRQHHH